MTIAASFTPKPAILSFAITHELLTMRLFLDSLANNNFRMKQYENSRYNVADRWDILIAAIKTTEQVKIVNKTAKHVYRHKRAIQET